VGARIFALRDATVAVVPQRGHRRLRELL